MAVLTDKQIVRKDWLLRAGELCTEESFIVKGCFRTIVTNQDGFDHVLFFSIENWWASDLASFLTKTPATLSIQALEDSAVLQLTKKRISTISTTGFRPSRTISGCCFRMRLWLSNGAWCKTCR